MPTPNSLGAQIARGANRLGDGRPYGSKGNSWGEYREGHKIATTAIAAAGPVTRANSIAASARLAEAGVQISRSTLEQAAKQAPGKSPVRMGEQTLKLPQGFVDEGRKIVLEMRELGMPNLKCMLKAELNTMIKGTRYESEFEGGQISDGVYYRFLDRSDCFSNDTKPLEDDRALWRHSQNARTQYLVWAGVIVDSKLACWAQQWAADPKKYFDEAKPYDELIIWYKGAEFHFASCDETDVAADETARGGHGERRSVQAAEGGSRCGRGIGKAGRPGQGRLKDAGWAKSKKERKEVVPIDTGETPAAKGGGKFTYVDVHLGSGDSCRTLIISKVSREALAKKIDLDAVAPECSQVDVVT
eukprot:7077752-Prymnesium_polylepis.1